MSESKVKTAFLVLIGEDSGLTTLPLETDGLTGTPLERKATTYDIYRAAKEISTDIEQQLLAARLTEAVVTALQPSNPDNEFAQRLQQRLAERKAETES